MAEQSKPKVCARAYTMRLEPADPKEKKAVWQMLWKTHEAVNKGTQVFGDWLLTLRGGLSHMLVDAKVPQGKNKPDRDPTSEERQQRRVLLALSWLSVESERGAPASFVVATGKEPESSRKQNVIQAFNEILNERGLSTNDASTWVSDCSDSLQSAIRDDAVWVNRSRTFEGVCRSEDLTTARSDAKTLLWYLLGKDYLELPKEEGKAGGQAADSAGEEDEDKTEGETKQEQQEESQEAVVKSGKGAGQRSRHPSCHIFGEGKPFGKPKQSLALRKFWRHHLASVISFPVETSGKKGRQGGGPSPAELHREMFSKAASRVAQINTKRKQQELERTQRKAAQDDLAKLEGDPSYSEALGLLNRYCVERGTETGALAPYLIRPRQIDGWDRVVAAWSKVQEGNEDEAREKRVDEAKRLQEEDPDKKFGDINLFIRLAERKYKPVWWHDGKLNASVLKTYVKGTKARSDSTRLKVDCYRHPDPYYHPVFCQFGTSRPHIRFRRLKAFTKHPGGKDVRAVGLQLWDGARADIRILHAVSDRFDEEIGSSCESAQKGATKLTDVSRRNKLSMAAIPDPDKKREVRVAHVFDRQEVKSRQSDSEEAADGPGNGDERKEREPQWNGALKGDRDVLEKIGEIERVSPTKAAELKERMSWWLIVSLELEPRGPWYQYVRESADKTPFERTFKRKGQETKYVAWAGWTFEGENKVRPGRDAKIILSRLAGLRVLSVDLGHRYAAACAVWRTLTAVEFRKEIEEASQIPGSELIEKDLYALILGPEKESNAATKKARADGRVRKFRPTTLYRRIGPDQLDGKHHPAPWARLERQFVIKLQGEEAAPRMASRGELEEVKALDAAVGREEPKNRSCQVDELMFNAVRTARLALRRHGDRARIAFAMTSSYMPMPGDRKYLFTDQPGDTDQNKAERRQRHVVYLQDILMVWHDLAFGRGWKDDEAKMLWGQDIEPLPGYSKPDEVAEEISAQERKKKREANREKLTAVAQHVAGNLLLRQQLQCLWKSCWATHDAEWPKRLGRLTEWILPKKDSPAIRHVGGLSLNRINTLTALYQLQKAFAARLMPDGSHAEVKEGFSQRLLNARDQLRENRVKQLASRVAAAALGIGGHWEPYMKRKGKEGWLKAWRWREDSEPKYKPCHAVVVENLTHYRPEQTQTRRENCQLMSWSSSKVKKYLGEACQLHALHLREVSPAYTSRQDSRTGGPGIRCQDVPIAEFLSAPLWSRQVAQAEKKPKNKRTERDRYILALRDHCSGLSEDAEKMKSSPPLRIPMKGGDIFVSADPESPGGNGIQADLNAAANIGLRALLDPDWPGRWWYVPCNAKDGKPAKDRVSGSPAINMDTALRTMELKSDTACTSKGKRNKGRHEEKTREIVNLWRDPSSRPISANEGPWESFTDYWQRVEKSVVERLEQKRGA